jgi:uncharacterized membrane protein
MNSMTKQGAILAAAAAAIFVSGIATQAVAEGKAGTIHCEGVNSCKGHSDCATDHSSCNGKNECAGKGWKEMTSAECDAAKAAKAAEAKK